MQLWQAQYKTVPGEIVEIEFEHEFDENFLIIAEAKNLTHNFTMYQLYVGYLIYDSIRELAVA